ncbi:MAG TPA: hypothetical protein VGT78_06440 [Rhizomicrobium sp.]|nr:hypothetical protein [Rhizomicrobium sp.]
MDKLNRFFGSSIFRILKGMLIGVTVLAYLFELGIGIFAGNYESIYHVVLPGYVRIRPLSRYISMEIYVAPWVGTLHHLLLWGFFIALGLLLILSVARRIAERPDAP